MSDRDILAPKKGACGDTIYLFICAYGTNVCDVITLLNRPVSLGDQAIGMWTCRPYVQ